MAESTEDRILKIARKKFVQKGFAATRMQEIADEAEINKAMLHYYFRNKEKLYREVVRYTLSSVIPVLSKAIEGKSEFWDRMDNLVGAHINILMDQPDIPIFILSELSQKQDVILEEIRTHNAYVGPLQSLLGQTMIEMQQGKLKQVNPMHLILNVMSMTVFPFVAKPIFSEVMGITDDNFKNLMKERKDIILRFIRATLEPD